MGFLLNNKGFPHDMLDAVPVQVQEMKYRTRIPAKQGVTCYGIMDVSNFQRKEKSSAAE